jgi:hypothetical protein
MSDTPRCDKHSYYDRVEQRHVVPMYIAEELEAECAELRKDATRAIEAWDVTVLPKGRDGRMQEAMECLRAALGEKP